MSKTSGLPSKVIQSPRRVLKTIVIEVEAQEEDVPIKGNCSAIDPKTDREQERWIEAQLEGGNPWAWASVRVRATMDGASGDDYLGCCSYLSGENFCQPDGYFPDMVKQAIDHMFEELAEQRKRKG